MQKKYNRGSMECSFHAICPIIALFLSFPDGPAAGGGVAQDKKTWGSD